jgi:hypothetical protein
MNVVKKQLIMQGVKMLTDRAGNTQLGVFYNENSSSS